MISFRSRRLDHTHDAPNKRNMCKIHGGGGGGGEFRKFAGGRILGDHIVFGGNEGEISRPQ